MPDSGIQVEDFSVISGLKSPPGAKKSKTVRISVTIKLVKLCHLQKLERLSTMSESESPTASMPYAPPWIFGITNIPFGVAGTYSGVAMPFLLQKAGVPVGMIATIAGLSLLPAAYQLFWAPIVDVGMRRRSWLILCSFVGSFCLASTLILKLPEALLPYEILMVIGQLLVGLVASCNGALVSTRVDPAKRGQAAGFVNAANLGSAVLGGGVILSLANNVSKEAAAIGLVLMICLPALAALAIPEPAPEKEPILDHVIAMAKEVWRAVRSRTGWTGLCFCLSPVGTVALLNLLSALGKDYGANSSVVEMVNGYGGGFVTALFALASGFILDRSDKRKLYLIAGILTATVAIGIALAPKTVTTYVVGCLCYMAVAGLAYAAFSAVVYEIVGTAGKTASTLYSVFPAAGNQAIAYTVYFDGQAGQKWGTQAIFWSDAALNILGVFFLFFLLRVFFPDRNRPASSDPGNSGTESSGAESSGSESSGSESSGSESSGAESSGSESSGSESSAT